MTVDEALDILEEILETQLNKVQRIVFRQAWEGQSGMVQKQPFLGNKTSES